MNMRSCMVTTPFMPVCRRPSGSSPDSPWNTSTPSRSKSRVIERVRHQSRRSRHGCPSGYTKRVCGPSATCERRSSRPVDGA